MVNNIRHILNKDRHLMWCTLITKVLLRTKTFKLLSSLRKSHNLSYHLGRTKEWIILKRNHKSKELEDLKNVWLLNGPKLLTSKNYKGLLPITWIPFYAFFSLITDTLPQGPKIKQSMSTELMAEKSQH
jgi:hypothetical protein